MSFDQWRPCPFGPVMVTGIPGIPVEVDRPEIAGEFTVKATALDHRPYCLTCALPVTALDATVATIWVPLQLTTVPMVLPSHTDPVPCASPKPEPEIVTDAPGDTELEDKPLMAGVGARVTVAVAVLAGSATLVAVTMTICWLAIELGTV